MRECVKEWIRSMLHQGASVFGCHAHAHKQAQVSRKHDTNSQSSRTGNGVQASRKETAGNGTSNGRQPKAGGSQRQGRGGCAARGVL